MDANSNGRDDKPLSLREIREQKRLIRAKLELHQLKNAERVLEASANWDYWLSSYVDLLDRYRDGGRLAYPISQPTDRRYGQNWPFWNTETQLSLLRAQARLLCTMNGYAIGLLSGLQAYVIGDGFQYRVVDRKSQGDTKKSAKASSFALKVQEIIDEFCDVNAWSEWERELFWRSREDGEFFLRFYPDNDNRCMTVRCVEPEQVSMTGVPEATQEHWSFGIHTDPEDVQTVYGYNVLYMADPSNHDNQIREEVPIEEMLHFKINVKRTVKRGLSDFAFSTHDAFTVAEKLRNNMAEGAAVQSALAYIRQHESATQAQIQNFLNTQQIDFTRANPLTGQQINYKQLEPGTIADIPRGMQYVQPPGAGNASGFIDILHATLRGAGCRWNAPEWLATGSGADMAAYTASLTAHAPFVRSATQKQNAYKKVFTQVLWEAIEYAIDYGRLPLDTPHLVDIQCETPSILARDEQDEAQANQIRVTGGWKSRQTVQQEEGLNPEQEMQNIEAYNERFGQGGQSGKAGPVPVQEAHFNPDEPRDDDGKWMDQNAGAVRPRTGLSPLSPFAEPAITSHEDFVKAGQAIQAEYIRQRKQLERKLQFLPEVDSDPEYQAVVERIKKRQELLTKIRKELGSSQGPGMEPKVDDGNAHDISAAALVLPGSDEARKLELEQQYQRQKQVVLQKLEDLENLKQAKLIHLGRSWSDAQGLPLALVPLQFMFPGTSGHYVLPSGQTVQQTATMVGQYRKTNTYHPLYNQDAFRQPEAVRRYFDQTKWQALGDTVNGFSTVLGANTAAERVGAKLAGSAANAVQAGELAAAEKAGAGAERVGAKLAGRATNAVQAEELAAAEKAAARAGEGGSVFRAPKAAPAKPPLPRAEADVRGVPRFHPEQLNHVKAAQAEEELARTVHSLPDEVVVRWGDPIGSHGADVISVNQRTGAVTLWDAKFRSGNVPIQPSPTFVRGSSKLKNAVKEAIESIEANNSLPTKIRDQAILNLKSGELNTRTVGFGNARNSTLR